MRKQELVHMHQLLAIVRRWITARGDVPPAAFENYREFGVRPMHVHQGKDQHQEAIMLLLDGITSTMRYQERALPAQ